MQELHFKLLLTRRDKQTIESQINKDDKAILKQRLHQVMINARLSLDNKNERWLYDGNYG